jgi:endonuclease-3
MPSKRKVGKDAKKPLAETEAEIRARAERILKSLKDAYPDAHVPLNYSNPLELLVATILSAQCTDARVNEVTATLFKKYRTAADWARASLPVLEGEVRSTGFFRSKARAIKESTEDIVGRFGGEVPSALEDLVSLRGVGRKSANVVIAHAFGGQGIIVDTHFTRLSRRMGLTIEFDPVKIEFDLMRIVPEERWSDFSLMLTWHGRVICTARNPECGRCPVAGDCPAAASGGEITWKVKVPAWKAKRAKGAGRPKRTRAAAKPKAGGTRRRVKPATKPKPGGARKAKKPTAKPRAGGARKRTKPAAKPKRATSRRTRG